jgi:hypothetical protein
MHALLELSFFGGGGLVPKLLDSAKLQVMALCQAPFLMDDPHVGLLFPSDAIARAKKYLTMNAGGVGAYSDSRGVPGVRQEVADFILERDGHPRYTYICFLHRFIVVGLWSLSPEMLASILTLIS